MPVGSAFHARTLELCERCLSTARISRGEVGEVLLVGGQSRMLAVRDAVKDFFSKEPRRDINPDEVVAVGAALYGYSLSADTLQQEAHDAAEDAFEVALRQTEVARKIVKEVEELIEAPVALLSTSPEREDTILVTDPFAD